MSVDPRKPVLVIGLGRFGSAVAATLERMGHEVLGADADAEIVREHKDALTQNMLVVGMVKDGGVTFAYPQDAKRNLFVQRKK